jgi:hypothetical protein
MRSPVTATVAAAAVLFAGTGTSAARPALQTPPPLPPIPKLPKPPKVPGEETETFKLVFEGTSHADRVIDGGGDVGPGCKAQLHEDIQEDVTFGRGKGVTMEFVRDKIDGHYRYGVQRAGRVGDSSFNVVAKIKRTAVGAADILQEPAEPIPCAATQHFDLSQDPDCGKTISDNTAWGLRVKDDHFVPNPTKAIAFRSPDSCGSTPSGSAFSNGGEEELTYGWATPAKMGYERLPLHKIFDKRFKRFKIEFKSLPLKASSTQGVGFVIHNEDHGTAESTVRFIRE